MRWAKAAVSAALLTIVLVPAAGRAFPGGDGLIVFVDDVDGDLEIFVRGGDGNDVLQLTHNTALDFQPAWSPDGTRIVFTSEVSGNLDIFRINPDGTGLMQLTDHPNPDLSPTWTRNGRRILFSSGSDGDLDIWSMKPSGADLVQVNNSPGPQHSPSVSPNGKTIVLQGNDGDDELFSMPSSGGPLTQLTNNSVGDASPSFHPTRPLVIFNTGRDGNEELYLMNANGSNPIRLTNNTMIDSDGVFSPSGNFILFDRGMGDNFDLFRTPFDPTASPPADGNKAEQLTNTAGIQSGADQQPLVLDLAVDFDGPMSPVETTVRSRAYELSATNNGEIPATGVTYTLKLDAREASGLSGVGEPTEGECDVNAFGRPRNRRWVVNCTVDTLEVGETVKVEIKAIFGFAGEYPWLAIVSQDSPPDYRPENNRKNGEIRVRSD